MNKAKKEARRRKRLEKRKTQRVQKAATCKLPVKTPMYFELDPVSKEEWRLTLRNVPRDTHPLETFVKLVGPIRKAMRAAVQADSCIASTRIAMAIGEQMGIPIEPLSVRCDVFNPPMTRFYKEHDWDPPNPDEDSALAERLQEEGCHALVVGADDLTEDEAESMDPGKWNGHLVALIAERYLLDMSFDQFRRPAKGIHIKDPLIVEWHPDGAAIEHKGLGIAVRYLPRDDETYKTAPDWTRNYVVRLVG
jgi:hypothetical protein